MRSPCRSTIPVPFRSSVPFSNRAESRLLFVGSPAILGRIEELARELRIVSFCRSGSSPEAVHGVISWQEFLDRARRVDGENRLSGESVQSSVRSRHFVSRPSGRISCRAPVDFDSLATLRYTSGTTGSPKGIGFTHAQLLWMAETLASLLPWRVRTTPARYLSFLPMNHVVEGILGAYAPYAVPAPVDVYFLEDFHALSSALPRVRPTIFFSVPRFYEKVWERFASGLPGRLYAALPEGVLRNRVRPLLRIALLRRAGLDCAGQLIAGSAHCTGTLLDSYRELGIEIYNAYGLTEAPLVTLNRVGANRIGTVGEPLPSTEVKIAPDGEILVRGPQVSEACCGEGAGSPVSGGWLSTGDLGELRADGSLVIRGRKKELLVTSYGKNILPGRYRGEAEGDTRCRRGDDRGRPVALCHGSDLDEERDTARNRGLRCLRVAGCRDSRDEPEPLGPRAHQALGGARTGSEYHPRRAHGEPETPQAHRDRTVRTGARAALRRILRAHGEACGQSRTDLRVACCISVPIPLPDRRVSFHPVTVPAAVPWGLPDRPVSSHPTAVPAATPVRFRGRLRGTAARVGAEAATGAAAGTGAGAAARASEGTAAEAAAGVSAGTSAGVAAEAVAGASAGVAAEIAVGAASEVTTGGERRVRRGRGTRCA